MATDMQDPYEDAPTQALNTVVEESHVAQHAPLVSAGQALASPQATGEDRLKASNVIKEYAGSNEFNTADFIGSLLNGNVRDMIIAATGGSDRRVRALDQNGKEYFKVFNQRTTKANPTGELRRIESLDGKVLTDKELEGKTLATMAEIPFSQRGFFQAEGIAPKAAAEETARQWNQKQKVGAAAISNAATIEDSSAVLDDLLRNKGLMSLSVNPETRGLLSGIASMGTGDRKAISNAGELMNRALKGEDVSKEWSDFFGKNAGLSMGLKYGEDKQLRNAKGEVARKEDVEQAMSRVSQEAGSNASIQTSRDALLNKAQILAAKGQIANLDLVQKAINEQYKIQSAIGAIEKEGGIGVAKPNVDFQTGDSFSYLAALNESNRYYGQAARNFADVVKKNQEIHGPYSAPAIGKVDSELATDPRLQDARKERNRRMGEIETLAKPLQEEINKQSVNPALLQQPGTAQTQIAPVVPNVVTAPQVRPANAPAKSVPPTTKTPRPLPTF